jgi:2-dehydropantoate 2-reductase
MRIAVFGAGSMGSVMGGILSLSHEVTLVGRREHVEAINRDGLHIMEEEETVVHPIATTTMEGIYDLILLAVKAYDTAPSVPSIMSGMGEDTVVMALQNGLENYLMLAERVPRLVTALTSWGATMLEPGRVRLSGRGDLVIGSLLGREGDIELTREALESAGIDPRVSTSIESEIWRKAVINACINPLTALARRKNGCLLEADMTILVEGLCDECTEVANAWGMDLDGPDMMESVLEVVRITSNNRSSMLQDLERGRRTEIDDINGSLVGKGERRGVDVPLNRCLWSLVRTASRSGGRTSP